MNQDQRKAVIHWYEENKASIVPIASVPSESRYENAICRAIWDDGKEYAAKVYKISSDVAEIEKADNELNAMIAKSLLEVPRKRTTKPKKPSGVATDGQVASALGERKPLSPAKALLKRNARKGVQQQKKNAGRVEKARDLKVASLIKKNLFSKNAKSSIPPKSSQLVQSISDVEPGSSQFDKSVISDEESSDDDDIADQVVDVDNADETSESAEVDMPFSSAETTDLLKRLLNYRNLYIIDFLKTLTNVFSSVSSEDENNADEAIEYAVPLNPSKEEVMVALREGYDLQISRAAKTQLLLQNQVMKKSPVKLLKKTLIQVFGSKQLSTMTAKGTRNFKGIKREHLLAIKSFVNRHAASRIEWDNYIREINRKCYSLRGVPASESPQEKESKSDGNKESASGKEVVPFKGTGHTLSVEGADGHGSVTVTISTPSKSVPDSACGSSSATGVQVQVHLKDMTSPLKSNHPSSTHQAEHPSQPHQDDLAVVQGGQRTLSNRDCSLDMAVALLENDGLFIGQQPQYTVPPLNAVTSLRQPSRPSSSASCSALPWMGQESIVRQQHVSLTNQGGRDQRYSETYYHSSAASSSDSHSLHPRHPTLTPLDYERGMLRPYSRGNPYETQPLPRHQQFQQPGPHFQQHSSPSMPMYGPATSHYSADQPIPTNQMAGPGFEFNNYYQQSSRHPAQYGHPDFRYQH